MLDLDKADLALEVSRPLVGGDEAEEGVLNQLPGVTGPMEAGHEGGMLGKVIIPPGNDSLAMDSDPLGQLDDPVAVECGVGPARGQHIPTSSGGPGLNPHPDQVAVGALPDH